MTDTLRATAGATEEPPLPAAGRPARVGVVGAGHWGPNLIRNFATLPQSELAMVCDVEAARLPLVAERYPDVALTTEYQAMLRADVDAIAVATPVRTHYGLVKQALLAGKHVLVEKPLTANVREAAEVVAIAEQRGLLLMVDHTMLLAPATERLRALVRGGELGDIWHVTAERLALGLFRPDVNVLWDLAPHDVALLIDLLEAEPIVASARGAAHVRPGIQDVAYIELRFPNNVMAHVHVSWLDPGKVRRVTVIGSKKMAVLDDTAANKLQVFDRGVEPLAPAVGRPSLLYRYGEGASIPLPEAEPLRRQCALFVDCVRTGARPRPYAQQGLKVVRILEQADRSLQNSGHREALGWDAAGWGEALSAHVIGQTMEAQEASC